MNANPNAQNKMAHRQVSTMHSCRMFTTSRVRAKPASSIMKPACMKNTRNAAISVQAVFRPLTVPVSWAWISSALGTDAAWATVPTSSGPNDTMA